MPKLIVKQPFNEDLEENKNKENEEYDQNKNKHEIQENKEEQEKPISDPTRYESEETHGGNETTNSIQNSINPSEQENENKQLNEQSEENEINQQDNGIKNQNSNNSEQQESYGGNTNDDVENNNNINSEQHQNDNSNNLQVNNNQNDSSNATENAEQSNQSNYSNNESSNTNEQNENNNSQNSNNEENGITQQFDNTTNNTEQKVNQQSNQNNGNNNQNTNNFQETNETKGNAENNNNENEGTEDTEENNENEGNEEDNEDEEDENNKKQLPSGQYNTRQVVNLTGSISVYAKYYQTEFYRFIETFAEEKIKIFDNKQPEEYNIKKLMLRKYEKKPLNHYKGNKIKDTVILILDNSGSMEWWSKNLRILSLIALQRNDIQIYIAPNGDIQHMITKYSNYIPVYHPQVFKSLVNKKIIYVGDFDGADTPIELSWHNEVIWICPETRYRRFLSHNWVHYSEDKFNGVFIRAYDLNEMFNGLKKITRYFKLFIDFHINDEFQDD